MAIFPQSPAKLLAAFGVAALSFSAPAAIAQGNDTSVQSENGYPVLTSEEALEQSNGKVLLHVGEGYNVIELEDNIRQLAEAGLKVNAASGGPSGQITSFFFGNHFPDRSYEETEVHEMVYILIEVAKQNNLIPETSEPTSP